MNTFGLELYPCSCLIRFSPVICYLRKDALISQIAGIYVKARVFSMVLGK